jgi:hypothetical protein
MIYFAYSRQYSPDDALLKQKYSEFILIAFFCVKRGEELWREWHSQ